MKRVMLLLANGVEPLELAAFTDVLGWADLVGDEPIELVPVGLRETITTTFGLSLNPNKLLKDVELADFDALALPGGFEPAGFYDEAFSESYLSVIRYFVQANKLVASVCVSAICLGVAGVLNGKQATTYHQVAGKRKQQLLNSGAEFVDRPIVVCDRIITSSGPGTAVEVALQLLALLTDSANAENVRRQMRIPLPSQSWYETPQVA